MRFTAYQYDQAIQALQDAKEQLGQEANPCSVCGDSGHLAYECGFNPLVAVVICKGIAHAALILHDGFHDEEGRDKEPTIETKEKVHHFLHWLAGFDMHMGVQCGPAKVIVPPVSREVDPNAPKEGGS